VLHVIGKSYGTSSAGSQRSFLSDKLLATRAARLRIGKGFDPSEMGYTQEEFDALSEWQQRHVLQDWVIGVEVETTLEHNPVARRRAKLEWELGVKGRTHEFLTYPSLDLATTIEERGRLIDNARVYGSTITLHTEDLGDVAATAWVPNFKAIGYSGITLCEEVAGLLAVERLKRMRESRA